MSQHTTQESCDCPLSDDPFVQTVIRRKVRQLMVFPEFYLHEEEDLRQELLAQLDVGMKKHRADVGHRNPFIVMVVDRKAANLLEYRRQQMRAEQNIGSLNVPVTESDGKRRDRIHCISEDDQRRKLEVSQLSRTEVVELRCDLQTIIASLPDHWQQFLQLRSEHSLSETARIMGVPRSTANSWVPKIAAIFEEAGLRDYLG